MSDLPEALPASQSKIDRFFLGTTVIRLVKEKKTVREIAKILTESDGLREIGESISHEAVSSWIRKNREEQRELRQAVAEEILRDSIGADISLLDELADRLRKDFEQPFEEIVEDFSLFGIDRKKIPVPFEKRIQLSAELRQLVLSKHKMIESGAGNSGGGGLSLTDLVNKIEAEDAKTGGDLND